MDRDSRSLARPGPRTGYHAPIRALALGLTLLGACETAPRAPVEPSPPAPPTAPVPPAPPAAAPASAPPRAVVAPSIRATCAPSRSLPLDLHTRAYSTAGGAPLHLDVAAPARPGPHPWVAVFHGGGWSAGARGHVYEELRHLTSLGYAGVAVDYRLVAARGQNRHPTQVADARCAVRYLRRHADALGLDPDRGAALGYSAGGHLALMLALAPEAEGLDDCEDLTTSPAVQLAISFYGPTDLRPEAPLEPAAVRIVNRFLGADRDQAPARAAAASPITYVGAVDAPVMLAHGGLDGVVPLEQSRALRAALARGGVPVQLVEVPRSGHGFRLFGRQSPEATCTTLAFLEAALGDTTDDR